MKKLLLQALLLFAIRGGAQQGNFVLTARIGHPTTTAKAYLYYELPDGQSISDSAQLKDGLFEFTGQIPEPVVAKIVLDHEGIGIGKVKWPGDILFVALDWGATHLAGSDSIRNARVTGLKTSEDFDQYRKFVAGLTERSLNDQLTLMSLTPEQQKDTALTRSLVASWLKDQTALNRSQGDFAYTHTHSYSSLWVLEEMMGMLGRGDDLSQTVLPGDSLQALFDHLDPALRTNKKGMELGNKLHTMKSTALGAIAPSFVQNDPGGRPVSLDDFRGKYVLLDFWASWCGPCRAENPHLRKVYQRFKDKKFAILGVSLDRANDRSKWIEAIQKDSLSWTQVSDLKGLQNDVVGLYNVSGVPTNFLIDPQGRIVARNLRGPDLEIKLEEVLGK